MSTTQRDLKSYFAAAAPAIARGIEAHSARPSTAYGPKDLLRAGPGHSGPRRISLSPDQDSIRLLAIALKASQQASIPFRCAIVNAANSSHRGGGVRSGASAQEEALCRHTTLIFQLDAASRHYPLNKHHLASRATKVLATPDVKFTVPILQLLESCPRTSAAFMDHCIVERHMDASTKTPPVAFEIGGTPFHVLSLAAPNRASLTLRGAGGLDTYAQVYSAMQVRFKLLWMAAREARLTTLIFPIPGCGSFARVQRGARDIDLNFVNAILSALRDSISLCPPDLNIIIPDMGGIVNDMLRDHNIITNEAAPRPPAAAPAQPQAPPPQSAGVTANATAAATAKAPA